MTANKTPFVVVAGAIQDGPTLVLQGQRFTPATLEAAERLLAQGLIAPVQEATTDPPVAAAKPAARAKKPAPKAAANEKL